MYAYFLTAISPPKKGLVILYFLIRYNIEPLWYFGIWENTNDFITTITFGNFYDIITWILCIYTILIIHIKYSRELRKKQENGVYHRFYYLSKIHFFKNELIGDTPRYDYPLISHLLCLNVISFQIPTLVWGCWPNWVWLWHCPLKFPLILPIGPSVYWLL